MPDPIKGETKEEFIARFMSSPEAKRDFPDNKRRLAVAYSKWRKKELSEIKEDIKVINKQLQNGNT